MHVAQKAVWLKHCIIRIGIQQIKCICDGGVQSTQHIGKEIIIDRQWSWKKKKYGNILRGENLDHDISLSENFSLLIPLSPLHSSHHHLHHQKREGGGKTQSWAWKKKENMSRDCFTSYWVLKLEWELLAFPFGRQNSVRLSCPGQGHFSDPIFYPL